jgi:SAM-dependent methyltransferase
MNAPPVDSLADALDLEAQFLAGHPGELVNVPAEMVSRLRCAACKGRLTLEKSLLRCVAPGCAMTFPVVSRVPVMIADGAGAFTRDDFLSRRDTTFDSARPRWKRWVDARLPALGENSRAGPNYRLLARLLLERSRAPDVLVIGGSILGNGMEELVAHPNIRLVETDVAFGPRTQIICDAHELPFAPETFDGVVIQAVLQYVADPPRCVAEIERTLRPGGLVYAETAFMQQVVHGGHDFTRFTHLGLRRLFRRFAEIRSGPVGGPGMALAWAAHFFLLSFARGKTARSLLHVLARLTLFGLKHFDKLLADRPGTYDAASGFYFLGTKSSQTLSDRELVARYQGAE